MKSLTSAEAIIASCFYIKGGSSLKCIKSENALVPSILKQAFSKVLFLENQVQEEKNQIILLPGGPI